MILNDITKEVDPGAHEHLEYREISQRNEPAINYDKERWKDRDRGIYTHSGREKHKKKECDVLDVK